MLNITVVLHKYIKFLVQHLNPLMYNLKCPISNSTEKRSAYNAHSLTLPNDVKLQLTFKKRNNKDFFSQKWSLGLFMIKAWSHYCAVS